MTIVGTTPYIIAITGGIGSGKSVVSKILAAIGYAVYDCDSRAKCIMDSSLRIKQTIAEEISRDAVTADGAIDRKRLSTAVFSNPALLEILNKTVHSAVIEDIKAWSLGRQLCFVETAILYQSGLYGEVHEVWEVEAPTDLRIRRVMHRSKLSREEVEARIAAQDSYEVVQPHSKIHKVINNGVEPLLPQVLNLLNIFSITE